MAGITVTPTKVTGAGGRQRTVYVCDFGCWHGSYAQASRCKNAQAKVNESKVPLVARSLARFIHD